MTPDQAPQDLLVTPAPSDKQPTLELAHDLKNIITGMRGYTELIRRNPYDAWQVLRNNSELIECVDRLQGLVDAMLSPPARGLVSLATQSRLACARLGSQAVLHHVRIHTDLDEQAIVLAAKAEIDAIVENLLTNALDAMPDGGELHVSASVKPDQAVLSVKDTGGGVDPLLEPLLFQQAFTVKPAGHGLGLPAVRRAVDKLGGSIQVANDPGHGLAVVLQLPLAPDRRCG